ncbi:Oxoglutarate/iron-dependent dioxygenase [Macleaya cordata]|uniref:Oxoglutarate/iron-dependent dioxygenase n=1 Tax=Macleaya cordata TaxID=56857 RepID=A0A200PN61_MACCD|nr:Oxoglutarate/iron-dependent dioxygenase [Macleaya cordata]
MEEYKKKLKDIADRLMRLMLDSLGISKEDLRLVLGSSADESVDIPHTALQLNSYPACPDPNRAMGLAPHTDTSLFTILSQSRTKAGLQIHRDGFGWITVRPVAGALVVNIGDLFHILTNGRFSSAVHRAVVNQTDHRLSIAYFYGPPCNSKIAPISKLVDSNHPLRYRSTTWREYIGIKARHFDKSLSLITNRSL